MGEYERSITINATRKQIEDFVSDFRNLPKYVPTTHSAQAQPGDRVRVQGETPTGLKYDADGYFRVNESKNRLEWGSDGENQYSGWLEFKGSNTTAPAEVTVHLSATPPPRQNKKCRRCLAVLMRPLTKGLRNPCSRSRTCLKDRAARSSTSL